MTDINQTIDELVEEELRTYVCDKCGAVEETPMWEAPTFNGFIKMDETIKFFPANIDCKTCNGGRMYEEGSNPMGNGSSNCKFAHDGSINAYMQIKHRPRGGI